MVPMVMYLICTYYIDIAYQTLPNNSEKLNGARYDVICL